MTRRAAFGILLASLLLAASAQNTPQKQRQAPISDGVAANRIIFAVFGSSSISGSEPGTLIDPVVMIAGSHYVKPPEGPRPGEDGRGKPWSEFRRNYYAPGTRYPLYFGGKRAGEVSVQRGGKVSCRSLAALVTMTGLRPLQTGNFALAVFGGPPASHANERRFAKPAELQVAMTYAQRAFAANGVRRHLLGKAQAISVVVTDLDRDGQYEMVASYKLAGPGAVHRLFLILYNSGDGTYQPLVSQYNIATDADMTNSREEMFVDQIDLDGDGMDEVFTRTSLYQGWTYAMYKKGPNGWGMVYTGGGGGC
ncbi:MAG: VCBS repeat-containing protein [Acidobacteriota bacterium]|nr:VCBS repeat-containing protein [Acidobacteriota bacterium]